MSARVYEKARFTCVDISSAWFMRSNSSGEARVQVFGVWCVVSSVWCLVFGAWCGGVGDEAWGIALWDGSGVERLEVVREGV